VDPHAPMLDLPAKLPPGFQAVVDRALEKDPVMRYRSAAELAQALAPYASASARERAQRLIAANPGAMPSAAYQVMLGPHANTIDAASGQALNDSRRPRGRARALLIAGAGVAAAAVIGVATGPVCGGGGGERGGASVESRAAISREPLHPDARSESLAAPPPDAGSAARASTAPASATSGAPPPTAPPGPPAPRSEAAGAAPGSAAPAPTAPGKPRPRPATVDPYSSPD